MKRVNNLYLYFDFSSPSSYLVQGVNGPCTGCSNDQYEKGDDINDMKKRGCSPNVLFLATGWFNR